MHSIRIKSLVAEIQNINCNASIVGTPENIFYLTGFWGSGFLVLERDRITLYTNPLDGKRAISEAKECEVRIVSKWERVFDIISREICAGDICFDDIQASLFSTFEIKLPNRCSLRPGIFHKVRRIKDQFELDSLRRGGKVIDELYRIIEKEVKFGMSERVIAARLLSAGVERGCDPPSFQATISPIIVASGPNSAHPHIDLTDRKIKNGDSLIIDITMRRNGYVADATRTFIIGRTSSEIRKAYEIVKDAQELGVGIVKEGISGGEIDFGVRNMIRKIECIIHNYWIVS